jgi:multiple sugar transport system ATP-binding protein
MCVASFVGNPGMNFLPVHLHKKEGRIFLTIYDGKEIIKSLKNFNISIPSGNYFLGIRPEDILISQDNTKKENFIKLNSKVEVIENLGSETLVSVLVRNTLLKIKSSGKLPFKLKEEMQIYIFLSFDKIHLFNENEERMKEFFL